MESLDTINKLMLGLGILTSAYTIIYGLLIWRGNFAEERGAEVPEDVQKPTE